APPARDGCAASPGGRDQRVKDSPSALMPPPFVEDTTEQAYVSLPIANTRSRISGLRIMCRDCSQAVGHGWCQSAPTWEPLRTAPLARSRALRTAAWTMTLLAQCFTKELHIP